MIKILIDFYAPDSLQHTCYVVVWQAQKRLLKISILCAPKIESQDKKIMDQRFYKSNSKQLERLL